MKKAELRTRHEFDLSEIVVNGVSVDITLRNIYTALDMANTNVGIEKNEDCPDFDNIQRPLWVAMELIEEILYR